MSKCPYTFFKNMFKSSHSNSVASELRVTVLRDGETVVDVSLPAKSARWLIDLIPADVVDKIKSEGIPIETIQQNLAESSVLRPQDIFNLMEPRRNVKVWLQ